MYHLVRGSDWGLSMGFHSFNDSVKTSMGGLRRTLTGNLFFSDGLDSSPLVDVYSSIKVSFPQITGEGVYTGVTEGSAFGAVPTLNVLRWCGDGAQCILYLHPTGEFPYDLSAKKIFFHRAFPENISIAVLRAPFHESVHSCNQCTKNLSQFAEMVAVSAQGVEEVVSDFRARGIKTIVCGLKLGGWIANLHHALSDTADIYIPIFAGSGFGDIFIDSAFASCVSPKAKKNHQKVRRVLNFDDSFLSRSRHSKVYPLLAMHDRVAVFLYVSV